MRAHYDVCLSESQGLYIAGLILEHSENRKEIPVTEDLGPNAEVYWLLASKYVWEEMKANTIITPLGAIVAISENARFFLSILSKHYHYEVIQRIEMVGQSTKGMGSIPHFLDTMPSMANFAEDLHLKGNIPSESGFFLIDLSRMDFDMDHLNYRPN